MATWDTENDDAASTAGSLTWSLAGSSASATVGGKLLPYTTAYVVSIRSEGVPRVRFGAPRSVNVLGRRDPLPFANTQPVQARVRCRPVVPAPPPYTHTLACAHWGATLRPLVAWAARVRRAGRGDRAAARGRPYRAPRLDYQRA
jgi:hypothetical protein